MPAPAARPGPSVEGDVYGSGNRGVLLVHGGRFNKESWRKQAQALSDAGFLVFALRFRGDRTRPDGSPSAEGSPEDNALDVLGGVAELKRRGALVVSAVGASLGGDAVGDAIARSKPGEIERAVFLGSSGGEAPGNLTGRKLFIVARDDQGEGGRVDEIKRHYAAAPMPKRLLLLEGSAHAQFLFDTPQAERLMSEIRRFLSEP
jgi:pimeloyl-ACP methyl ester carboxylesterase